MSTYKQRVLKDISSEFVSSVRFMTYVVTATASLRSTCKADIRVALTAFRIGWHSCSVRPRNLARAARELVVVGERTRNLVVAKVTLQAWVLNFGT